MPLLKFLNLHRFIIVNVVMDERTNQKGLINIILGSDTHQQLPNPMY